MFMINFMLPVQFGAMTFDGTWLILLGIIAVMGIVYKNRNNISLTSTDYNINKNDNATNKIELEDNNVVSSGVNEIINSEEINKEKVNKSDEVISQEIEEEIIFN